MSKVKELMEKRNDVLVKMTAIIDKAEEEVRAMTEAEQTEYENYKKEVEGLNATIKAAEERSKQEAGDKPKENNTDEEYRALDRYFRGEARALQVGTNGSILPRTIANQIIAQVKESCPIMQLADVYHVKGELVLPYYDETSNQITAAYMDEFGSLTEKSGEIKAITLKGWITGALAKISNKLINNTDFDIVGFVTTQIVNGMVEFVEKESLNGNASKTKGILQDTTNIVTAADSTLTADLLIELQLAVKTAYQNNAVWIMNTSTFAEVRKLKDGDGKYLVMQNFVDGSGWMLLGKKVYLSDAMPKFAASQKVIIYGDLKGYTINMCKDIETQVLQEKYSDQYAIGVHAYMEFDGAITNQQALAVLEMGAGA